MPSSLPSVDRRSCTDVLGVIAEAALGSSSRRMRHWYGRVVPNLKKTPSSPPCRSITPFTASFVKSHLSAISATVMPSSLPSVDRRLYTSNDSAFAPSSSSSSFSFPTTPLLMFVPKPPSASRDTERTVAINTVSESLQVGDMLILNFPARALTSKSSSNSVNVKRRVMPFSRSSFKSPSTSFHTAVPERLRSKCCRARCNAVIEAAFPVYFAKVRSSDSFKNVSKARYLMSKLMFAFRPISASK